MGMRPAWSSAFDAGSLKTVERLEPLEGLTRDWAWGGGTGSGVRVAVIDSGVDATHPAIDEPVEYVALSEAAGEIKADPSPHSDDFGHGTACAGISRSLAPECTILSVKVLGPGLAGRGTVLAAGLKWATENGAHVCNLSLGTTKRDFFAVLHELVDNAYFRRITLVTAANNVPIASYPSVYSTVISVAAHDVPDPDVYYCNPDPPVDFGAHGIDVRVPWLHGEWITVTGNSFAAPHITGLVARLLGKHSGLTVVQVKSILRALATNVVAGTEHNMHV